MPRILISYRRSDADAIAGRIHDRLSAYYGDDSVFMDIDSIPFATDFRDHIQKEMHKADVVLAIVGPQWLGAKRGRRYRIEEETDPVRIEIESAFKLGIPLMPILVGGARMPQPSELPPSLEKFPFINAPSVDSGRDFRLHIDRVMRSIDAQFGGPKPSGDTAVKPTFWTRGRMATAAVLALAVLAAGVGAWFWIGPSRAPVESAQVAAPSAQSQGRPAQSDTEVVVDLSQIKTDARARWPRGPT